MDSMGMEGLNSSCLNRFVIHTSVSPTFRAYTVALEFIVLFLYASYRLANRRLTETAG